MSYLSCPMIISTISWGSLAAKDGRVLDVFGTIPFESILWIMARVRRLICITKSSITIAVAVVECKHSAESWGAWIISTWH